MVSSFVDQVQSIFHSHKYLGALLVIPFLASVPGYAGSIQLPTTGYSCILTDPANPSPGTICTSAGGGVGSLSGGGDTLYLDTDGLFLNGDGSVTAWATAQVSTAIPVGTTIDYSYDFGLFGERIDPNWSLDIDIADEGQTEGPASVIGGIPEITGTYGLGSNTFSGSGSFTTTVATAANDYIEVYYIIRVSSTDGDDTIVTVPQGTSVDLTPVQPSGVPEPGSIGLLGAGLLLLGWKGRQALKARVR